MDLKILFAASRWSSSYSPSRRFKIPCYIRPSAFAVCIYVAFPLFLYIIISAIMLYECVSKSFRTGRLERELQMVQLSATRCSCIAIL